MNADAALERELADFVAAEAALLDDGRYDDWLALFADDGVYWVPLDGARQVDPHRHHSIAYEDRALLQLRVARLKDPQAHSQHPRSASQHVLQRAVLLPADDPTVSAASSSPSSASSLSSSASASSATSRDAETHRLRTPFLYVESRGDEEVMLAGTCRHRLSRIGGAWKIREKRIDLLNPGRPLPAIQLFL